MIDINTGFIISKGRTLAADLIKGNEPFEVELGRTKRHLLGLPIAFFFLGGPVILPALFCLEDAVVDGQKLQKIKAEQLALKSVTLNKNSTYKEPAELSLLFQQKVYENLSQYTQMARKAKHWAGLGFLITFLGLATLGGRDLIGKLDVNQLSAIDILAISAIPSGCILSLPAACYGLYHRFTMRPKLIENNTKLAKLAQTQLQG